MKRYDRAMWQDAAKRLAELPAKAPQELGITAGLAELRPALQAAKQRGYDAHALAQALNDAGIQVAISSVRNVLKACSKGAQRRRTKAAIEGV